MPRRRWGKEGEWGKEIDKEDGTKSRNKSRTTKDFESESETHSKHLQNKSFLDHSGWILSWKPSLVSVPGIPSPRIGEDLKKPAGQSVIWHGILYQVISWWQTWQYVASIFDIACLACHVLPNIQKNRLVLIRVLTLTGWLTDLSGFSWPILLTPLFPTWRAGSGTSMIGACLGAVFTMPESTVLHLNSPGCWPWRNCPEVFGPAPFSGWPDVLACWLFARVCETINIAFASLCSFPRRLEQ